MPIPNPTQLFDGACQVLAAAEFCLTDNGITLPVNRFVTACDPDNTCCDTLAVQQGLINFNEDVRTKGKCFFRMDVYFNILITRCAPAFTYDGHLPPTGSCAAPDPGTISGAALEVLTDRYVLARCLATTVRALSSEGSIWCCQPISLDLAQPICGGGCAGTQFTLRTTI